MSDAEAPDRLLRMKQVEELTGLSARQIYRLVRAGTFPKQFKPGGYASRWSEAEIREWVRDSREATAH